ncbi:MAG: DEAD/DEAH box helicase [Prevotella sp.]|nr:DEAD/DEAH box helicase [Prevotella sp.]
MEEQTKYTYTAGQRITVRGEDFLITDIKGGDKGSMILSCKGISPLVIDKEFCFDTLLDDDIKPVSPKDTHFIADTQGGYRLTKLYIETALRSSAHHSQSITISQKGAFDEHNYQYVPTVKAFSMPRPRMLIADAVGLGKTIEVGIFLSEMIRRGRGKRILVIALKSILKQFQEDLWNRFAIPLVRLDSVGVDRIKTIIPLNKNPFDFYDKTIISVDTLKNSTKFRSYIEHTTWDIVVIDECHKVANTASQRGALAQILSEHCDSLVFTSATPHNGRAENFASLIRMLEPTAIPLDGEFTAEDIKPFYVRRFKNDLKSDPTVASQFQDRQLVSDHVQLNALEQQFLAMQHDQFKLYKDNKESVFMPLLLFKSYMSSPAAAKKSLENRLEKENSEELRDQLAIVDKILETGQDSKYNAFVKKLEDMGWKGRDEDERIVVFTERLETINYLKQNLERDFKIKDKKIPSGDGEFSRISVFQGGMLDTEQDAMIENFGKQDSPIRMLICSDAGAQGVNLHYYCHRMFNYDIPWSLITLEQRNGRIDRYKQPKVPFIHYLVLKSDNPDISTDFRIIDRLKQKEDEVNRTLGDAAEVFQLYDVHKEEEIITTAIVNDDEDIWAKLGALGLGTTDAEDTTNAEKTITLAKTDDREVEVTKETPLSIYQDDMDFYTQLFRQLESDHLINHGNVTFEDGDIHITNTPELDKVLFDMPQEAKPKLGRRYHLSAKKEHVFRAIEVARVVSNNQNNTDGIQWADTQVLYDLHPVIRYMLTKLTASIPKNDAPVARVESLPQDMAYFVMSAQVSNQKGDSVISDFIVCPVQKDGNGIFRPMPLADFIDQYRLREKLYTSTIAEEHLDILHHLLPEAIENAQDYMDGEQVTKMKAMNTVIDNYHHRLEKWKNGEEQQLSLFADESLTQGFAAVRIDKRKKKVEQMFESRDQYLNNIKSLSGDPFIKVLAAFYHF